VVELIHTATLLHDDVVDESTLRRGRATANETFGNPASVLVGDFLHTRSFQMMVEVGSMRVLQILSDATNVIAEGEVQQLINTHDASLNEAGYLHVIRSKTAQLFEASAQLAAVLAGATPKWSKPAQPMARHWERHSRSLTMCSTTPATLRKWARTWAMTCAKANAPCP
jgi:octaprenyl-diphosphate synthase